GDRLGSQSESEHQDTGIEPKAAAPKGDHHDGHQRQDIDQRVGASDDDLPGLGRPEPFQDGAQEPHPGHHSHGDGTDQAVDDDAQAPDSEPTEMREGPQTSQVQEVGGDEDDVEWAEGRDVVAEDGDESHRQDARRPYEESQADQLPGESFSPVVAPGTPEEEQPRGQVSHQHGGMPENGAEFRTK